MLLVVVVFNIPFVNEKLSWRLDELRSKIIYFFHPPAEAVFVPAQRPTPGSSLTPTAAPTKTLTPAPTSNASATPTGPTATPTVTPTPLPASVTLPGVVYIDQTGGWNLCGPSNLAMALKFWKWNGTRDEILHEIKPGINDPKLQFFERGKTDKNVMPYEMVDYVNNKTSFHAIYRYGGNPDLLKRFIAAGYPMLIEKGEYQIDVNNVMSWMGHYQFITGYNDADQTFLVQDTYKDGPNHKVSYAQISNEWRAFDYIFMIVYPAEREDAVHALLGDWADPQWANQHALDIANQETKSLTGLDAYFAWFNKGTSHVALLQYFDAASAYDQAFLLYPDLPVDKTKLPYRMMWYQTGPYKAYFYASRYKDVISLANVTLATVSDGSLEESLFWRGMAEQAIGAGDSAVADFKAANHLNPKMNAAIQALQSLGITPEVPVK